MARGRPCLQAHPPAALKQENAGVANTDSFIDEVTEEVRRDRVYRLVRRHGWIAVVAVVGIVGFAAVTEWQRAEARAAAQATGDALLAALDAPDAAARAAAAAAVAPPQPGAAALARLIEAAEALSSGTPEGRAQAQAAYAAVAADTRLGPEWRDLAALRAVLAADPPADPAAREAALAPLAEPGRPYRVLAQEQIALARLEAGDRAGARAIYAALAGDSEAPQGLRRRAAQMMVVLDAGAGG
jgi:hypothetical protein